MQQDGDVTIVVGAAAEAPRLGDSLSAVVEPNIVLEFEGQHRLTVGPPRIPGTALRRLDHRLIDT